MSRLLVIRKHGQFLSTPSARRATTDTQNPAKTTTFLSTPSARRATHTPVCARTAPSNFYPRPLRGGRPGGRLLAAGLLSISIHALCEEGDGQARDQLRDAAHISIHALCEEGDRQEGRDQLREQRFLSTPSARRATDHDDLVHLRIRISIHALCEEGDTVKMSTIQPIPKFLSTPSARRATTVQWASGSEE